MRPRAKFCILLVASISSSNLSPAESQDTDPHRSLDDASASPLRADNTAYIGEMVELQSGIALYAADGPEGVELRRTDGTVGGMQLVKDIRSGADGSWPDHFIRYKNKTYFVADDGTHGEELWATDGTEVGTQLVADALPGEEGISPRTMMVFRNRLLFTATDPAHGTEIWTSDGTSAGTSLFIDLRPGPLGSGAAHFTKIERTLYFVADDGVHGRELWKTDGTSAGTRMIKDGRPGATDLDPLELTAFPSRPSSFDPGDAPATANHQLIFFTQGLTSERELWKTDGTEDGTTLIKSIPYASATNTPQNLVVARATAFFVGQAAFQRTGGFLGLWRTDGTTEGTRHARPYQVGGPDGPRFPTNLSVMGNTLYFAAYSLASIDLWRSDGTPAGTSAISLAAGLTSLTPEQLTVVGTTLFFSGYQSTTGINLWTSDGTPAGTLLVKDFEPGNSVSRFLSNLRAMGGKLLFNAKRPDTGEELWVSDGTDAGTFNLADIRPGTASSSPHSFRPFAGGMLFETVGDTVSHELWRTDGTIAGTYKIESFDPQ